MKKSTIVMIGPSLESGGGISTVVNTYKRSGLFDRWALTYISSYVDVSNLKKISVAITGLLRYFTLLFRGRVSLLHVHSASKWSFIRKSLFMLPTFLFRKPVIFQLHGGEFLNVYKNQLGSFGRTYIKFVISRCARIIVLSPAWKVAMEDVFSDADIRVILNPIDEVAVNRDNSQRESNMLLFLGRLEERKGIYDLFNAVSSLDEQVDVRLLMGGTGDMSVVESAVDKLGIRDKVEFLGWVDGSQKSNLLYSATALVLPSYAEGLPMSVLEAMAHGTAVVATPVGGVADVIDDGEEGFLVRPGNAKELATAIGLLLTDSHRAIEMGTKGRQKYEENFKADVVIPQVESLYLELGCNQ